MRVARFAMVNRMSLHVPVLADEVVDWLELSLGHTVVDGTLGGGGHTRRLAESVGPQGLTIAVDRDPLAVEKAQHDLSDVGSSVHFIHGNYCDLPELLQQRSVEQVDGILLDLGLSSDQLADADRGFSFDSDGPLDLRFDPSMGQPASKMLNRLSPKKLADILWRYGEERFSRRIARHVVEARRNNPIQTARQLADIVARSIPHRRGRSRIHPATRTFQALRIAINDELNLLERALRRFPSCLCEGGRVAIISFHSLEDRCVKQAFRDSSEYQPLTKKPIRPSETEISQNPRSRSARLRVAKITRDSNS